MEIQFTCEFCGTSFNRECNLITHKKTARYCLEKRGIETDKNKCKECGKCFSKKINLKKHETVCPIKTNDTVQNNLRLKDDEIKTLKLEITRKDEESKIIENQKNMEIKALERKKDKEIQALREERKCLKNEISRLKLSIAEDKGKISVYKERPGVINNNTQYINPKLLTIQCDTIPPLTVENVKKEVTAGKYTYENFIRAEVGLVDFIATLISDEDQQKNYVCTDTSRNKFHRLIETREWENDNGATFLNKILDQLCEPTKEYYSKVIKMTETPTNRDIGELLMTKTKPMVMGIIHSKSKDRGALFNRIRTEVRKLASI